MNNSFLKNVVFWEEDEEDDVLRRLPSYAKAIT
jgi:hypothetical protein